MSKVLDYKPSLKKYFYELAGNWLLGVLKGTLEKEDKFTLRNPDKAYLEAGGFFFLPYSKNKVVGCIALKRLDENTFELAKLFIDPGARNLGIATKLIRKMYHPFQRKRSDTTLVTDNYVNARSAQTILQAWFQQ